MTSPRRIIFAVLVAVAIMFALAIAFWPRPREVSIDYKMPGNPGPKIAAAQAAVIERRERVIDQTIWRKEIQAEEYGRVFENSWDALNAATNKWDIVHGLTFDNLTLPDWTAQEDLGHGIKRWKPNANPETRHLVSYDNWRQLLDEWRRAGWQIMQCEFRHNAFDPQTNDVPAKSRFYFSAHLTNASPARAVVEGDLLVEWKLRHGNEPPAIARIDASNLQLMFRAGPPAFVPIFAETMEPPPLTGAIEPLLVYDLDNDGIPEIALPAANKIYRWRRDHYEAQKFCSTDRLEILNGLFADFDGDGVTDFLYLDTDAVYLLKGAPGGKFETPPRALTPKIDWFAPRAVTCGDIDGDGDLDIFVGQYKRPFAGGSMPTPYYDANDGYPSYLFLNDGKGNLTDATQAAGLATAKRNRHVYSASFVDLDGDGALDLVVASDFAGVDIYRNDSHGKFTDVTTQWLDESHAFGMGHAFGDFNNDGRLDFYVTGMTSATADRLEHLDLRRPNSKLDPAMRVKMSSGSKLYLAGANGRFGSPASSGSSRGNETLFSSGWSWGVSAADFDNDGGLDLYVVNGMESLHKVHDYEGELWLHDMFIGNSVGSQSAAVIFAQKNNDRRRASESFGGYDKNRLFLNRNGAEFINVAHLLGVALESDCRNLVAADLNADGRIDLIMTSQHSLAPVTETIRVFQNDLTETGNWIAFAFRDEPGHRSPIGAQVVLQSAGTKKIAALVTGDSFRSQHPAVVRFGLGQTEKVDQAEIRWPGGAVTRIAGPEINRTHAVRAPKR
jgi:hypothetical protein